MIPNIKTEGVAVDDRRECDLPPLRGIRLQKAWRIRPQGIIQVTKQNEGVAGEEYRADLSARGRGSIIVDDERRPPAGFYSAPTRAGDRERVRDRISRRQKAANGAYAEENRVREQESARNAVPQGAVGTSAKARTLSASAFGGSFYVYSYDGRLLTEYDRLDNC